MGSLQGPPRRRRESRAQVLHFVHHLLLLLLFLLQLQAASCDGRRVCGRERAGGVATAAVPPTHTGRDTRRDEAADVLAKFQQLPDHRSRFPPLLLQLPVSSQRWQRQQQRQQIFSIAEAGGWKEVQRGTRRSRKKRGRRSHSEQAAARRPRHALFPVSPSWTARKAEHQSRILQGLKDRCSKSMTNYRSSNEE